MKSHLGYGCLSVQLLILVTSVPLLFNLFHHIQTENNRAKDDIIKKLHTILLRLDASFSNSSNFN